MKRILFAIAALLASLSARGETVLAHWPFTDGSLEDASGHGYTLTNGEAVVASDGYLTFPVDAEEGTSWAQTVKNVTMSGAKTASVSLWLRHPNCSGSLSLMELTDMSAADSAKAGSFRLGYTPLGKVELAYYATQADYLNMRMSSAGHFDDGEWHQITATLNVGVKNQNPSVSLYVDGTLDSTSYAVAKTKGAWDMDTFKNAKYYFARRAGSGGSGGSFAGDLADVIVYGEQLPATNVLMHYCRELGRIYKGDTSKYQSRLPDGWRVDGTGTVTFRIRVISNRGVSIGTDARPAGTNDFWFVEGTAYALAATTARDGERIAWGNVPSTAVFNGAGNEVTGLTATNPETIIVRHFTSTHVWTGAVDTDFAASGNWVDNLELPTTAPSGASSVVLIPEGIANQPTANVPISVGDLFVGSLTNGAGTATFTAKTLGTNVVSGSLFVLKGGTLTHTVNSGSAEAYKLNFTVSGDVTVAAGAKIVADGMGFVSPYGPGKHTASGAACKPCHGGSGYDDLVTYGSILEPTALGSSGGTSGYWAGPSGGAVYLSVRGTCRLSGTLSANAVTANEGQSGTGGSIYMRTARLEGTGPIQANGGRGGGGRIALVQTEGADWSAYSGTFSASSGNCGGGTIYRECAADVGYGELIVKGGVSGGTTPIHTGIGGHDHVFGKVTVEPNCKLVLYDGVTLSVTGSLSVVKGGKATTSATGGWYHLAPSPGGALTVESADPLTAYGFACESQGGGTVRFVAGTVCEIMQGGSLTLLGEKDHALNLASSLSGSNWVMNVGQDVVQSVRYLSVSDSRAPGAMVTAYDSVSASGENEGWAFMETPIPGAEVLWTGEQSDAWGDAANWNPKRVPLVTDAPRIPAAASYGFAPRISSDQLVYAFRCDAGGVFTLAGATLTVTNGFTNAGTMVFEGKTELRFAGDGEQEIDLAGKHYPRIVIEKPCGGVTFADGFSADTFRCVSTQALTTLRFAAGKTVACSELFANGLVRTGDGWDHRLAFASATAGTAWRLAAGPFRAVRGVTASDSDASDGEAIHVGSLGTSMGTGNVNWAFSADAAAVWTGAAGSTDFATAENWYPAAVPDVNTCAMVLPLPGVTNTILLAAATTQEVHDVILGGDGGTVLFTARGRIVADGSLAIAPGVTATLDFCADANRFGGSMKVWKGGTVTHSGNGSTTESYKLRLEVGGDATVETGAKITADGKGFAPPGGLGHKGSSNGAAYKAFHGGAVTSGDLGYGSLVAPTELGSSHGNSTGDYWRGYPGGAVYLSVGGNIRHDGSITANTTIHNEGASATGGSVYLRAGEIAGTGAVRADGGWGGGGRIALVQTNRADWTAFTGLVSVTSGSGGGGTIYRECTADAGYGELIVKGGVSTGFTPISTQVRDADHVFGNITVMSPCNLRLHDGATLSVTGTLSVASGATVASDATGGGFRFVPPSDGMAFADVRGTLSVYEFTCESEGGTVKFLAGSTVSVLDGGSLTLRGTKGNLLNLVSSEAGSTWSLNLGQDVVQSVRYLSVSDSRAPGAMVTAYDSVSASGENEGWAFMETPVPGAEVLWTGEQSDAWGDAANWNPKRVPLVTDAPRIPAATAYGFAPRMSSDQLVYAFRCDAGAVFTLTNATLTVTNGFTNAGTMLFDGKTELRFAGDAEQAIDLAGKHYPRIVIEKPCGGVTFADGFQADTFRCVSTQALTTLRFAAGKTVACSELFANGLVRTGDGWEHRLAFASAAAGTAWRLAAGPFRAVRGVTASDSDASDGETIHVGSLGTSVGTGNVNWDFTADAAAVWTGAAGTTDFATAENWYPEAVPDANTCVMAMPLPGVTNTILLAAATTQEVHDVLLGGDGGAVAFTARGRIVADGSLAVADGATATLDFCADANRFGGSMKVWKGGTVTHSGNGSTTESYKLRLEVGGDATVETGAKITADGKGFAPPGGLGHKGSGQAVGQYAFYGGAAEMKDPGYGSILRPTALGSSHGNSTGDHWRGYGGGAVYLSVGGNMRNDGSVTANTTIHNEGSSGSGGSVYVRAAKISGTGVFRADGSWGAGGRVAVCQREAPDWSDFAGTFSTASSRAGAGTVYQACEAVAMSGELTVRGGTAAGFTPFPMPDDGTGTRVYRDVAVHVASGTLNLTNAMLMTGRVRIRDLTVDSATAKIDLCGAVLEVTSPMHKDGKGWAADLADVVIPRGGRIVWVSTGTVLIVR